MALVLLMVGSPAGAVGHMGPDFGFALVFGLFPFLALPLVVVVALLFWKAPWLDRALSFVVLALMMMVVVAIVGSRLLAAPWWWRAAPIAWLAPLVGWAVFTRLLHHRLARSPATGAP